MGVGPASLVGLQASLVPDAYGPNCDRLRAVKSVPDPDNSLCATQNIPPPGR